jgi:hypothetical protein
MTAVAPFDLSVANTQPYLTYPRRSAASPQSNGWGNFRGILMLTPSVSGVAEGVGEWRNQPGGSSRCGR